MAKRNSVSKLLPGNELGSVLRETARLARRSTRDTSEPDSIAVLQSEVDALQSTDIVLQGNVTTLQSQVTTLQGQVPLGHGLVLSDGSGNGTWVYPNPNPFAPPAIPVIQATAATGSNATVTITATTQTSCNFRVWNAAAGTGLPATYVFLTAFASSFIP